MNKEHFFIELKLYLNQLSKEEQQTIINTYERIFDAKLLKGYPNMKSHKYFHHQNILLSQF